MKKTRSIFLTLVLLLPAFISLVVLGATTNSVDNTDRIEAAIVNLDKPVTLKTGTTLPAGRQLVANLTSPDASKNLKWNIVSQSTAEEKLASGDYEAVVTIPETFSQDAANILQGNGTTPPQVTVKTKGSSLIAGQISTALTASATDKLGTFLTVNYLSASLKGTNTLASGISSAADGASQLADGQTSASAGAAQLADGTSQVNAGTATLAEGLNTLSSGSDKLVSGSSQLDTGLAAYTQAVGTASAGAQNLSDGSARLADGVKQYTRGVAQVHAAMTTPYQGSSTSLVDGASELSSGLSQLNSAVQKIDVSQLAELPSQLHLAASGAQQIQGGMAQLEQLIQACSAGNAASCTMAQQVASQLTAGTGALSSQLSSGANEASQQLAKLSQLDTLKASIAQLESGSQKVSSGISQIATGIEKNLMGDSADQLTSGATQLAHGSQQLSAGLAKLNASSEQLTSGASQLASGSRQLATGAGNAADGANQLSSATKQLSEGAEQLSEGSSALLSGTQTLSEGLSSITKQLPTVADDAVSSRAQALAQPVTVSTGSDDVVSSKTTMAAGSAIVALWLGSLMAVMALGKMKRSRLEEAATPLRLARESVLPALAMAAAQTLVIVAALKIADVDVHQPIPAFLLMLLAALGFTIINDALMAVFSRKGGVIASVTLFVVQFLAVGLIVPISTQDGFIAWIHGTTPLPQVATALQSTITGGSASAGAAVGILAVWVVAAILLEIIGVRRRRATSVPAIRAQAKTA